MYELNEDWGEANDNYLLEDKEVYYKHMEKWEEDYEGATEGLLSKGIYSCGIDTLTLKEVFNNYEICEGTLLHRKDEKVENYYACVNSICVNEFGVTEVNTQECWFYEGNLCYDYECYADYSVSDIYKYFDSVGEDKRLFNKGD